MKYRMLVALTTFFIVGLMTWNLNRKVGVQEKAVDALKEEVQPLKSNIATLYDPRPKSTREIEVYATGGTDRRGVFFMEKQDAPTRFILLDPTFKPVERGWAYYDPANQSWVVEIDGYRFGLK